MTAVGDPCQAIYGWRGASVHNIDAFVDHFPRVAPTPPTLRRGATRSPRTAAPAPASWRWPTTWPPRCARSIPGWARWCPRGARGAGRLEAGLFDTQAAELAWLASRVAAMRRRARLVARRRGARPGGCRPRPARRRPHRRRRPGRGRGTQGLLSRPEVLDVVSVLRVAARPVPQRRDAAAAHRSAVAARSSRPRGARPAGRRARRRGSRGPRTGLDAALDGAVAGSDPVELVALADAVDDPAMPAMHGSPGRPASGSPGSRPSCGPCAVGWGSRWSTSSTGCCTSPGSTSSWLPNPVLWPRRGVRPWSRSPTWPRRSATSRAGRASARSWRGWTTPSATTSPPRRWHRRVAMPSRS